MLNKSYIGERQDILGVVPSSARKVLDIGCSDGSLGLGILKQNPGSDVTGLERDELMAATAKGKLQAVHIFDLEEQSIHTLFAEPVFDCIILADVLEHLRDPWGTLEEAASLLTENGSVIVSIPNIRHISTIFDLVVRGVWPYRDRGIHDRTHLRFFTKRNIVELFDIPGLEIALFKANYRLIERPSPINKYFVPFLSLPFIRNFFAFQYIVLAKKISS